MAEEGKEHFEPYKKSVSETFFKHPETGEMIKQSSDEPSPAGWAIAGEDYQGQEVGLEKVVDGKTAEKIPTAFVDAWSDNNQGIGMNEKFDKQERQAEKQAKKAAKKLNRAVGNPDKQAEILGDVSGAKNVVETAEDLLK